MTWAYVAVTVVATAVTVYGQRQQAKQQKAIGEYNAKVAAQQAQQTEMDAAENLRRKRRENARILATQRSRFAKAGVVEEGTPLEVMAETAGDLELSALDYDRQQKLRAQGLRSQGELDRLMGANAARASNIQAGASLLQGGASIAGQAAKP